MEVTPRGYFVETRPCRVIDMTPGGWRQEEFRDQAREDRVQKEIRKEIEQQRHERAKVLAILDGASVVKGGSTVWDGGMLALAKSDIDLFITLSEEGIKKIPQHDCEILRLSYDLRNRTHRPIGWVSTPTGHWMLTGREPKQAQVLRGSMIEFAPAPRNAESSAIRRAGLKILGVSLCEPGPDVDETHVLRGDSAIRNALNWVEARGQAWEHDALSELAKRVRAAMTSGRDVREVL